MFRKNLEKVVEFYGFTLIELLVVIAIIAILAAILFPVFAQAREKARQAACLSNSKQIGTAIQLYTDDYDETLPGSNDCDKAATWPRASGTMYTSGTSTIFYQLYPYCKNWKIFSCPSGGKDTAVNGSNQTFPANNKLWNGAVMHSGSNGEVTYGPIALSEITRGSEIALFIERDLNDLYQRFCMIPVSWGMWDAGRNSIYSARHNNGENITYIDGHAKYCKVTQITFSMMGLKKKDGTDPQWFSNTAGGSSANYSEYNISL